MAVDFPPGIGDQSAWAISLKVTEEGLGDDLSAAIRSLKYINTWLTWSVAQRRSVPDVDSDALASRILALSTNAITNRLFTAAARHAPTDSDLLFRISSTVEELVNIPGVLVFTTASEALARAASCDKGKEKEPLVAGPSSAPPPRPQRSSRRPPAKPITLAKLTAAQVAALAAHLSAPTPLGKLKHPSKEEALVGMARVFPTANPTSLTNAQAAVSGDRPALLLLRLLAPSRSATPLMASLAIRSSFTHPLPLSGRWIKLQTRLMTCWSNPSGPSMLVQSVRPRAL